ncbi:nucleotidyltransferase [Cyanobium sp. AMD-g]|uniref:nucleotidyltransferase domain-containing protein n=1 Tax=Cyanobium sp. AMD-g TaxID=2823699 RepID=UPI0020CC226A|nr:nucleotidyltransferase [Cyanobium sp. AMD-g]MCP9931103.1 nucleotidyltransferase [Cyanobium sp. AMD-g]
MPLVQSYFENFHKIIKLDEDDEKAKLREKRDTLLQNLKANLPAEVPVFEAFHQGSYSMHTGIVPLDGNYDIDVGLVFDCSRSEYPDPVSLKKVVRDALNTHGRTIDIRRPCVTVNYIRDGEPEYHVDLAIYAMRNDDTLDLAKGKENSDVSRRIWEQSNPRELTRLICNACDDKVERAQYRRCIRYIKRWRDQHFSSGGSPLSIALTVAAMHWFKPRFEVSGKAADLLALLDLVKEMLNQFRGTSSTDGWHERLSVMLPVMPFNDLTECMTNTQMTTLQAKLESLRNSLEDAYDETLPEEACKIMQKQFGSDFPLPDKSQTAKAVAAPYISTGTSA